MISRSHLKSFFICFAIGLSVGIGIYTFTYAKGFSYLSTDPKACVNCHVMKPQYESWLKSSHHNVAVCADCHMPHAFLNKYYVKAENGFLHSKAFTLQNYADPIQIRESSLKVLNNSCIFCHNEMTSNIAGHSSKSSEVRECSRCHNSVGH